MLECEKEHLQVAETELEFGTECPCHSPCTEYVYKTSQSMSAWPSENSINKFLDKIIKQNSSRKKFKAYSYYQSLLSQNASQSTVRKWVKDHFLAVNVFANSRFTFVKEDVPLYTMVDILCYIGGCSGLWLGISLVTSVEIVQLVISLLIVSSKKLSMNLISSD